MPPAERPQIDAYISDRKDMQVKYASANKVAVIATAKQIRIPLVSHDDATIEHVNEAIADGVAIAEFPTTKDAADAAHANGLAVLMGAPDVVRSGSHSGNISAAEVAVNGTLNVFSSDYVPTSLLNAVFALPDLVGGFELPQALALVTRNPAKAGRLHERGEIAIGKRADLVQVASTDHHPVVRRVWREGQRVM